MTWSKLLAANRVRSEPCSRQEIDNLRSIVARCSCDIKAQGLSDEQRFIIAYDAARTLALMVVRASGYRPAKLGGHYNTFAALQAVDGGFVTVASYLDICRAKRNDSEYDFAGGISKQDADDLVRTLSQFERDAADWIKSKHPSLA